MEETKIGGLLPPTDAIKREVFSEEIKEFAETAMNELLGWYGYTTNHRETKECSSRTESHSSESDSPKTREICGWCGKPVDETMPVSSSTKKYCSELCFAQSRRAEFKKNKACDWCRHIRHRVIFVDSQDGATKLQFCSELCLNQYKMHIFWRETRAHLDMHPHIPTEENAGTLITPELWMSKIQAEDRSLSPKAAEQKSLPVISVAHPSKLMALTRDDVEKEKKQHQKTKAVKRNKRKLNHSPVCTSVGFLPDVPQDLRVKPTELEKTEEAPKKPQTKKLFDSLLPPPTLLVPYPIILPIPVPVPIPIPLPIPDSFYHKTKKVEQETQTSSPEPSETDLCLTNDYDNNNEVEVETKKTRPARKRARVIQKKAKVLVKNRKNLS